MTLHHMNDWIEEFIAAKDLSLNSQKSYAYDLKQFYQLVGEKITTDKIRVYEAYLSQLSVSAQKRKLSAVNQFLYALYEKSYLSTYYKLHLPVKKHFEMKKVAHLENLTVLYGETLAFKEGQIIALMIYELGLLPTELLAIPKENINLDFKIVKIEKGGLSRILTLPETLVDYLLPFLEQDGTYVLDNKGHTYTRQWLFNQLKPYRESIGQPQLTAQYLREQFILRQASLGKSIFEVATHLGLKSTVSLEKYFKT